MRAPSGSSRWWFEYRDVSDDPSAAHWADVPEHFQVAVSKLGFRLLGYAHAWLRSRGQQLVHEVWVSSDRLTQAVMRGPEHLELVTLFDDGSVLTTVSRPDWLSWLFMAPGIRAHPADRHLAVGIAGEPAELFQRHRERIERHQQSDGVRAVPVESMTVHFATRMRLRDLHNARFPPHFTISYVFGGVASFATLVAVNLRGIESYGPDFPLSWRAMVLGAPLVAIAGLLCWTLAMWWIAPFVVRLRPGPAPLAASELIARASEVERLPLPDESEW